MDSMAIYRGMDIGTAKPPEQLRRRVVHHLLDITDPWEEFSVAEYLRAAAHAAEQILSRRRIPLFAGGTPLYLMALLRGIDSGPPPDLELRERLYQQADELGRQSLHDRLASVDKAAAQRIHSNDIRRVVRALEVFETTGTPISSHQVHFHEPANPPACVLCLDLPRPELYRRIDERVQDMFQQGFVAEVHALMNRGQPLSRTARQAVGYKEIIEHLTGQRPLRDTIELVQRRSRQFAKRQLTWFRSMVECRRVPIGPDCNSRPLVDRILELKQLK
jgi:tRNA dimethylallyltransferase